MTEPLLVPSEKLETPLDWTLHYARLGWSVFPVCTPTAEGRCLQHGVCRNAGKKPLVSWARYQLAAPTEVELRDWWRRWPEANLAVATGRVSNIVVLDLDGELALREAERLGLVSAPWATTGRVGGRHVFYAYRDTAPRDFAGANGIDFRGDGGYVIVAPSRHWRGPRYTWSILPGQHPPLPVWVDTYSRDHPRAVQESNGRQLVGYSGQLDVQQLREFGVQEGMRDDTIFRVASLLRARDTEYVEALEICQDIADACQPPFSGAEARDKVDRVWITYAPNPPEQVIRLKPADDAEGTATPSVLRVYTARELGSMTPEQPGWLVQGLVARGAITELGAKIKLGKTSLATALVQAVASGAPTFVGLPVTQARVLYLTEQTHASFRESLRRAHLLDSEDVFILTWVEHRTVPWPRLVALALDLVQARGIELIVVDTLSQFAGLAGDDENSSGKAMQAMQPLQAIAAAGLAVVVIRHERKSGGDVGDAARGSSAFGGVVDVIISLQRPEGPPGVPPPVTQRLLRAVGRYDETPPALVIDLTQTGYVTVGTPTAVDHETAEEQILRRVPFDEEQAMSGTELFEGLGRRRAVLWQTVNELIERGEIQFTGEGVKGHPRRYYRSSPEFRSRDTGNGTELSAVHESELPW